MQEIEFWQQNVEGQPRRYILNKMSQFFESKTFAFDLPLSPSSSVECKDDHTPSNFLNAKEWKGIC